MQVKHCQSAAFQISAYAILCQLASWFENRQARTKGCSFKLALKLQAGLRHQLPPEVSDGLYLVFAADEL